MTKPPVHLSKHLPPYHGHLINDEVTNACHELLDGLQSVSFELFEVSFDWKSQQGVEGVAINIECSHSSWSSDAQLASKQKLETSNQV